MPGRNAIVMGIDALPGPGLPGPGTGRAPGGIPTIPTPLTIPTPTAAAAGGRWPPRWAGPEA